MLRDQHVQEGVPLTKFTFDRPTKPGDYWLAIHPDQRGVLYEEGVYKVVLLPEDERVWQPGFLSFIPKERLTGAQWSPRETPADPFAQQKPDEGLIDLRTLKVGTVLEANGPLHTVAGMFESAGERIILKIPDDKGGDGWPSMAVREKDEDFGIWLSPMQPVRVVNNG